VKTLEKQLEQQDIAVRRGKEQLDGKNDEIESMTL
jgi:hypothetical protein